MTKDWDHPRPRKTTLELLPTWATCDNEISKLGREGVSNLVRFIYDYENDCPGDDFLVDLAALIDEVSGVAIQKHYGGKK